MGSSAMVCIVAPKIRAYTCNIIAYNEEDTSWVYSKVSDLKSEYEELFANKNVQA